MTSIEHETSIERSPVVAPVPAAAVSESMRPRSEGDLRSRAAIHDLVVAFYREIVMDDLLAPVFEEVAEVDWAVHIPLLIDYWCRVLLGHEGYQGAILAAHRHLHDRQPLSVDHFERWYTLWVLAVDARWAGPGAEKAKGHAAKIAATLARRLLGVSFAPPAIPALAGAPGGSDTADTDVTAADASAADAGAAGAGAADTAAATGPFLHDGSSSRW
ncbi:MAG TPA: group III truncated hemoglobin [Acidimicrobiales bacterium]|nr:group III truncated hemoglobin [Acidimicrobiales bacterium]